jgi:hypothetical protein
MTGATAVNETLNAALLDHIDLLHRLAAPFAGKGKLILERSPIRLHIPSSPTWLIQARWVAMG